MSSRHHLRAAVLSTLVLASALLAAPLAVHDDDSDAQLYTVVVRNMAASGDWWMPHYVPAIYARFMEHLPFGFWPMAAVVRWGGEAWLRPACMLMTLLTVVLAGGIAARAAGRWAGIAAMAVLALTETFFLNGGRARLDVPLVLLTTASVFPLLSGPWTRGALAAATGLAGLAALIKGPFGLAPLAAAVAAHVLQERSLRRVLEGGLALALAAVPIAAFLLVDRASGGPWWEAYVQSQLMASATGARTDGHLHWYWPLRTVVRRFWPGLLLLPLGVWSAVRPGTPQVRRLGLACGILLGVLCLPARKHAHHVLIAYPLLAALVGAGVGPLLARWCAAPERERRVAWGLGVLAALAVVLASVGGARLLPRAPCVVHEGLAEPLSQLAPGTPVAVIAPRAPWALISRLAAERRLHPELALDAPPQPHVRVALVQVGTPGPEGWAEVARADGWALLRRVGDGAGPLGAPAAAVEARAN